MRTCTEATLNSMMERSRKKDSRDCVRLHDLAGPKYLISARRSETAFFDSCKLVSCLFQELDQHQDVGSSSKVTASVMITF